MQPHHKDRLLGKLSDSDLIPLIIVFNPVAGPRRTQLLWRVLDLLIANGVRVELVKTTDAGHAQKLAHAAATAGTELVVAAGGDGTIAEVANGLIGSRARLGVIPLGTANVLAHELGLPFSANALAAALAFRRTRLIWPGLARGIGPCGGERSRLFVQGSQTYATNGPSAALMYGAALPLDLLAKAPAGPGRMRQMPRGRCVRR
jgi:hypothetical protein